MPSSIDIIKQRLEYLADEVAPASEGSAERLRDLADAVDGGPSANAWATADIFQLIDPSVIADQV